MLLDDLRKADQKNNIIIYYITKPQQFACLRESARRVKFYPSLKSSCPQLVLNSCFGKMNQLSSLVLSPCQGHYVDCRYMSNKVPVSTQKSKGVTDAC